MVKEGETYTLRIIRIEPQRRRIGLSLERVSDERYAEIDWQEVPEGDTEEWESPIATAMQEAADTPAESGEAHSDEAYDE